MRTKILFILLSIVSLFSSAQDIKEIIRQADEKFRGNSSQGEITMTIERPTWSRTISMKNWTMGNDYSIIYITAPAKEKGQAFLKRENDMWNWIPSIERMVKIPPSMMMQSWMGSDFTNDDLVKESSLVNDYAASLLGEESIQNYECYKIELIPNEDAPVVWGKIIMWVSKEDYLWLKAEYYDEDEYLINTEILTDVKMMDGRLIPTHLEMIPEEKEGQKTIMNFDNIEFDIDIDESFFSQQNVKRIR